MFVEDKEKKCIADILSKLPVGLKEQVRAKYDV